MLIKRYLVREITHYAGPSETPMVMPHERERKNYLIPEFDSHIGFKSKRSALKAIEKYGLLGNYYTVVKVYESAKAIDSGPYIKL
jgi:hypothetical protein